MPEHGNADLGDLLTSLTERLPAEQERLDDDYLKRLAAFAPLLLKIAVAESPALAQALVPSPLVLRQVAIEVGVRLTRGRQRELALEARPLNLGYVRKYAHSDLSASQLRVIVERIPAPLPRSSS